MKVSTVQIPVDLIPAVAFLAEHFQDDIYNAQAGPYDYSDQERDATDAVRDWASQATESLGISDEAQLSKGPATYHQADELSGDDRQPWPNS